MALAAAAGASPLGACDGGAAKEGGGGCGGAGTALALEPHKVVPAPFLTKTYQLVDDPATDSIVSWGDDLSTFVVWRPPEFARDVLPNYFKHNNFSSFVRQLNTYGFRKIVPERWEFANEFFRKGEKHLLCEIHRRKTNASSPLPLPNPHLHLPFHSHYHPHRAATAAVPASPYFVGSFPGEDVAYPAAWCDPSSPPGGAAAGSAASSTLVDENERLRRGNAALLAELARMRELYNDIIYFVQNHVRPVAPSSSFPSALLLAPPPSLHPSADKVPSAPLHKRLSGFHPWQQHQQQSNAKACLNWSSTTSSSSVTIAEAPSPNNNSSNINSNSAEDNCCEDDSNHSEGSGDGSARPKLFGVSLGASSSTNNKRSLHPQEPDVLPLQPAAKRHLHHPKEDLGLNLAPPSPS